MKGLNINAFMSLCFHEVCIKNSCFSLVRWFSDSYTRRFDSNLPHTGEPCLMRISSLRFFKNSIYTNLGSCISIVQFFGKNRQKQALIFSPISFCVVPYFFLGFGLAEKFPYHLQFYWIFYRWLVNSKLEALWSEIGDYIRKLHHN